ncbi:MAG: apolipoprotein N-acyltransferase [Planctomycetota bacterium]
MSESRANKRQGGLALLALGGLGSAALLILAFPPTEAGALAWVALVPLLVALRARPGKSGWLVLWLAGFGFGTGGFFWARHVVWYVPAPLGLYVSFYFLLFCAAVRWLGFEKGFPFAVAAPLTWTALEVIRSVFLTGLPWLFLAHTQYKALPVVQMAELTGAAGVTFLLAAVNGLLADVILRFPKGRAPTRRLPALAAGAGVVLLAAGALWYGFARLRSVEVAEGPRVAAVQGNIPQSVKKEWTEESVEAMFETYLELTRRALAHDPPPDLILWPETMAPPGVFDRRLQELRGDWLRRHTATRRTERWRAIREDYRKHERRLARLRRLQERATLVISANSCPDPANPDACHNSAFLLPEGEGRGPERRYDKIHLVPFGEYVPLRWLLGWAIGPLVPYDLSPGDEHRVFEIDGWTFAPTICFEDAFPGLVADFAREHGRVDCIVNLTNEGWFKDGAELDQHLAIAVFRAVECRAGFIRAANTGISAFIEPTGRIRKRLVVDGRDREVAGVLHGVATTSRGGSAYLAAGEWFGTICTVAWFFCLVAAGFGRIRNCLNIRWGRHSCLPGGGQECPPHLLR